jgi:predicted DNA-binding transcriptional regulator YafY
MEYRVIDIFGKDNYERGKDDSINVSFHCSNREWLIHFVLGFGLNVKIIYPIDLKEEYMLYLKKIINKNEC